MENKFTPKIMNLRVLEPVTQNSHIPLVCHAFQLKNIGTTRVSIDRHHTLEPGEIFADDVQRDVINQSFTIKFTDTASASFPVGTPAIKSLMITIREIDFSDPDYKNFAEGKNMIMSIAPTHTAGTQAAVVSPASI